MANIELPKDAEGREIPLDTKVLYNEDGKSFDVNRFTYSVVQTIPEHKWGVVFMNCISELCHFFYLTPPEPPDSWEKLDEDLNRIARSALERKTWPCAYFNRTPMKCYGCRADKCFGHCEGYVIDSIKSRILKLRGEDE